MLNLNAFAKINLVLEVLGKRCDGYHEISSITQTVSLFDILTFEHAEEMELICKVPELQMRDNLVLKAANALKQTSGYAKGARIELHKRIPWGAGLGGGSSDAAATLVGLNRLWSLGLTIERLADIAADIGSDVPFFIYGGTCLMESRGEKISLMPDMQEIWFVLLRPSITVLPGKTGRLYSKLNSAHYTRGEFVAEMKKSILGEAKLSSLLLYNSFDKVAYKVFKGLKKYLAIFNLAGAEIVHLDGSGPVLFSMFDKVTKAKAVHNKLTEQGFESYIISTVKRGEIGY